MVRLLRAASLSLGFREGLLAMTSRFGIEGKNRKTCGLRAKLPVKRNGDAGNQDYCC
jgi:hypothetical protein